MKKNKIFKHKTDVVPENGTTSVNVNKKKKIGVCIIAASIIAVLSIVIYNNNKVQYEYKDLEYNMTPDAENIQVNGEKASEYLSNIEKDDVLSPDKTQLILHENRNLTDDNIYSCYEAIDWTTIPYGTFVYYYDDNHIAQRITYVPQMTEEMLYKMWNNVNSFEDFSITKGIKIFIDDEAISVGKKNCIFNNKNKTYTIKGDDTIPVESFDVSDINSNEEFVHAYFENEGLSIEWSELDEPILTGYECNYAFHDKDDNSVKNIVSSLSKEYDIATVTESDITYTIYPSTNGDITLTFVSLGIRGTTSNDENISLYVSYGIMMCY